MVPITDNKVTDAIYRKPTVTICLSEIALCAHINYQNIVFYPLYLWWLFSI